MKFNYINTDFPNKLYTIKCIVKNIKGITFGINYYILYVDNCCGELFRIKDDNDEIHKYSPVFFEEPQEIEGCDISEFTLEEILPFIEDIYINAKINTLDNYLKRPYAKTLLSKILRYNYIKRQKK